MKESLLGKRFSGKQEFLAEMYKTLGFPKDHDHGDKYDAGALATNARLKTIYDTQYTRARAQMQRRDDIESGALKLFPAQELKRGGARKKPRDWKKRWLDAGGKLIEGRMVALVDDPIWARISRWGDPLPPFDYNSGMKLFKVSRANAIRLGLLPKPESAARKAKPDGGEKRPVPAPETPKASDMAKAKLERAREAILGVPAPVEPPLSPEIKANAQIVAKAVGVKLGAPMTFEEGDGMKGNPLFDKGEAFKKNCQSCVVANEMRRRGMDVKSTGFDESNSFQNFIRKRWNLLWESPSGKPPRIRVLTNSKNSLDESLESAMGENGRYFVVVAWKKEVTGHIFCAERVNGGELLFYDPQSGAKGDAVREYFSRAKRSAWCFRVDDCTIAKNYVSSLSSVISPRS